MHYINIKIMYPNSYTVFYIGLIDKKIYFCAKYRYHNYEKKYLP